jgi:hypothetical protein
MCLPGWFSWRKDWRADCGFDACAPPANQRRPRSFGIGEAWPATAVAGRA